MKKRLEFSTKTRYNIPMLMYKGYVTHSLVEAANYYKIKTGSEPTILLVRPDYQVEDDHSALVRSRLAPYGMVCVSHLLSKEEIQHLKLNSVTTLVPEKKENGINYKHSLDAVDLQARSSEVYKAPPGRPKSGGGCCPHCMQQIVNFDDLGWWWGWTEGIEPPYWEELRLYIFRRDNFTCQVCHKKFAMSGLTCHHIQPKEEGGPDSAKNLVTLCHEHHLDDKPIFPE